VEEEEGLVWRRGKCGGGVGVEEEEGLVWKRRG